MKALVIGSGGREHAILWALKRTSSGPLDLYCAPGNAGIAELAECLPIAVDDHQELMEFVRANAVDMTIVGPEGPLAAGIVDEFESSGLKIMGPGKAASRLESSKAFAKDFMRRHGIPTAEYYVASSTEEALTALRSGKFGPPELPVVVKADGLAAGKGVVVARSHQEANEAINDLAAGKLVAADAAKLLVIEEALEGREVSVLLFADGRDYALMPPARDHKRIGENDTGPNTGGMGAITGPTVLDQATLERISREVVEPTLKGAADEGFPIRGILFVGLMLTPNGPRVLEYNVRFGDPETQAILMRLQTDLFKVFEATIAGNLREVEVKWNDGASACVVLASEGYPGSYKTGIEIQGLDKISTNDQLQVFHAGTAKSTEDELVTSGGRVLGVTAAAATIDQALGSCYEAIANLRWKGMQFRRDIGQFKEALNASSSEFKRLCPKSPSPNNPGKS
jgi:phosphoribosylamine--glycine ligase